MKKLKSLLSLGLLLCAAVPTWADVDYSAGISGLYKTGDNAGRYTSGLTLTAKNGDTTVSTKAITGLQDASKTSTAAGAKIYWDKSSEKITLEAGQTLHVAPAGSGNWMQQYMYIDWAGDGFAYVNEDTYLETNTTPANKPVVKDGADLVYFSVHAKDVNQNQSVTGWYYFNGTAISADGDRSTSYSHPFDVTIPAGTPAGEYRARYKVDWRNLDPTGAVNGAWPTTIDLIKSGGVIIDFTIEVTEPTPEPEPEPEPEVVLPEGTQVNVCKANGVNHATKDQPADVTYWTTNDTYNPGVKITKSAGTGDFLYNNGWLHVSPLGAERTITIESTDPAYYVKAFKFTATTDEDRHTDTLYGSNGADVDFVLKSANREVTCYKGKDADLYELEIAEDTPATFTIYCAHNHAKKVSFKDFVVVLGEKTSISNVKQEAFDAFVADVTSCVTAIEFMNWPTADALNEAKDGLQAMVDDDEVSPADFEAAIAAAEAELMGNATDGVYVQFRNSTRKNTDNVYHMMAIQLPSGTETNEGTYGFPTSNTTKSVWAFEYAGNGRFYIRNHYSNNYIGVQGQGNQDVNTTATRTAAARFEIQHHTNGTYAFVDEVTTTADNGNVTLNALHEAGDQANGDRVVKWSATSDASEWYVSLVSEGETPIAVGTYTEGETGKGITYTHASGISLTTDLRADQSHHHIALVSYVGDDENEVEAAVAVYYVAPRDAAITIAHNDARLSEHNDGYKLVFTNVPDGNYYVNVPAGFFTVDGKLSAPITSTVTVKEGSVTGIAEIAIEGAAAVGIYDLQGRRLAAPVKGINIINGKKVLVK